MYTKLIVSPSFFHKVYLSKAIFLDRANRETAVAQARKAAEDMKKSRTSIWIYPEGTRSHSAELDLLPFKKGAFYMAVQAKAPIVPIVVQNYHHLYDQKSKTFKHGDIKIKSKFFFIKKKIISFFFQ